MACSGTIPCWGLKDGLQTEKRCLSSCLNLGIFKVRHYRDAASFDSHDIAEAELTAIPPHGMEQHGEFSGDSD